MTQAYDCPLNIALCSQVLQPGVSVLSMEIVRLRNRPSHPIACQTLYNGRGRRKAKRVSTMSRSSRMSKMQNVQKVHQAKSTQKYGSVIPVRVLEKFNTNDIITARTIFTVANSLFRLSTTLVTTGTKTDATVMPPSEVFSTFGPTRWILSKLHGDEICSQKIPLFYYFGTCLILAVAFHETS